MNVLLPVHLDKPAFLARVQGREERYELAEGRVVMLLGATRAHAMIVGNLVVLLSGQLDPEQWTVIADFGLDAGPKTLRYPDVVVDRAGGSGADYVASAPVLVAEVLPNICGCQASRPISCSRKPASKPMFGRARATNSERHPA